MRQLIALLVLLAFLATARPASAVYCAGIQSIVGRTVEPYSIVRQEQSTVSGQIMTMSETGEYGQIVGRIPHTNLDEILGGSISKYQLDDIIGGKVAFIDNILLQNSMAGLDSLVGRTNDRAAIVAVDSHPVTGQIVTQETLCGE